MQNLNMNSTYRTLGSAASSASYKLTYFHDFGQRLHTWAAGLTYNGDAQKEKKIKAYLPREILVLKRDFPETLDRFGKIAY